MELFSEEIPARLQARGAEELRRLVSEALAAITPSALRPVFGARRIALAAEVAAQVAAGSTVERGPRVTAPEQALAGFLRKHAAGREDLREESGFWVLDRTSPAVDAASLIAGAMPGLLRRFTWPKSMRWGGGSAFTWIRPLRRIVCLLDGQVVPFALAAEGDDGHGLASGNLTEGHRFHAPDPVAVTGFAGWQTALQRGRVVPYAAERARLIQDGLAGLARAHGLTIVEDAGLLEEVAGLVEWPVPLLGRIDDALMDLPPEVMQVSMRVNQRYFATRTAEDAPAPWFAFASNVEASDGGAAIVAGNERVLRARFADARHFWDLDRRTRLADRVAALDGVTFQAELGSQGARARRLVGLAGMVAPLVGADPALAERAALLAKADLTTGMVGEFPELQGVMGGYYAQHDGEDARVAAAVREHYAPKGAGDGVPSEPVAITVALVDKIDQLTAFFAIGQRPTGSGDPYALRRAALGVIRTIRETCTRIDLRPVIKAAVDALSKQGLLPAIRFGGDQHGAGIRGLCQDVENFILERLRIQFKSEGGRSDILLAVVGATSNFGTLWPNDIVRHLSLTRALSNLLTTNDGIDLTAAYKRASNILRIEEQKDGKAFCEDVDPSRFIFDVETDLYEAVKKSDYASSLLAEDRFSEAVTLLAELRRPLDAFFEGVMVNDSDVDIRENRLRQLTKLQVAMRRIADLSAIES